MESDNTRFGIDHNMLRKWFSIWIIHGEAMLMRKSDLLRPLKKPLFYIVLRYLSWCTEYKLIGKVYYPGYLSGF